MNYTPTPCVQVTNYSLQQDSFFLSEYADLVSVLVTRQDSAIRANIRLYYLKSFDQQMGGITGFFQEWETRITDLIDENVKNWLKLYPLKPIQTYHFICNKNSGARRRVFSEVTPVVKEEEQDTEFYRKVRSSSLLRIPRHCWKNAEIVHGGEKGGYSGLIGGIELLIGNMIQGSKILTSFCLSKEVVDRINAEYDSCLSTRGGLWQNKINKYSKAYYFKQYKQLYNLIQYSELPRTGGNLPRAMGCFAQNTFHGMSWFCHWFKPAEIVFNFAELSMAQDRLSRIGLVDLMAINAVCQEDFDYPYPETLIAQRALTPILHSFYLLQNDGCLLNWNFGICTRLNIGLVYSA